MNATKVTAALLAAALAAAVPSCGDKKDADPPMDPGTDTGDKALLRLRLQRDQTYRMFFRSNQKIKQTVYRRPVGVDLDITTAQSFRVTDVDAAGAMTMQVTFHAVKVRREAPEGTLVYDSSKPTKPAPIEIAGFAFLPGQSFTVKMTPMGRVLELSGLAAMFEKMAASDGLPAGALKGQVIRAMKERFDDQALVEMLETTMGMYPTGPIGVGGSWQKIIARTKTPPVKMETRYTLKSRANGAATLAVDSKLQPNPDVGPIKTAGRELSYTFSGTRTGTLALNEKTGWITRGEVRQDLQGTLTATQGTQTMTIPTTIQATMTYSDQPFEQQPTTRDKPASAPKTEPLPNPEP